MGLVVIFHHFDKNVDDVGIDDLLDWSSFALGEEFSDADYCEVLFKSVDGFYFVCAVD